MTYDVKHPFLRLFSICVSSLVDVFKVTGPFFNQLVFLLSNFKSSLYILDNSLLSDVSFAKIFSQSVYSRLILLIAFFAEPKFYIYQFF